MVEVAGTEKVMPAELVLLAMGFASPLSQPARVVRRRCATRAATPRPASTSRRRLRDQRRQGVRRRRRAARPVAGRLGDPRRPPGGARDRPGADGLHDAAALNCAAATAGARARSLHSMPRAVRCRMHVDRCLGSLVRGFRQVHDDCAEFAHNAAAGNPLCSSARTGSRQVRPAKLPRRLHLARRLARPDAGLNSDTFIQIDHVVVRLRREPHDPERCVAAVRARQGHGHPRRLGLRQDDAAAPDRRRLPAAEGPRAASTARTSTRATASSCTRCAAAWACCSSSARCSPT